MGRLTDKQRAFVDHYIVHRSKVNAYRHAYPRGNMKESTVYRNALATFDKPQITQLINEQLQKVSDMAVIDAAWVLKRAAMLADFNINKFLKVDDNGVGCYNFKDATEEDWYCIAEYSSDLIAGGDIPVDRVKIKTVDKLKALEMVGKHIEVQAFKEKIDHNVQAVQVTMSADEFKQARQEMLDDDDI